MIVAVDNSASIGDGYIKVSDGTNANERMTEGVVPLEDVALIISALNKLEVRRVLVTSFGSRRKAFKVSTTDYR